MSGPTRHPLGSIFGDVFDAFRDPTVPIADDPAAEAQRLARQWRALRTRMDEVWPDQAG